MSTGWTVPSDFPFGFVGQRELACLGVRTAPRNLLIKLSWKTGLAKGHEDQCVRLLLSDDSVAVESWKPTVVKYISADPVNNKDT